MPDKVKQTLIRKHRKDCWAMAKYGGEWIFDSLISQQRDKLGRKNPKAYDQRFMLFRCNDASCPAQLIVREIDIIHACGISSRKL